MKTIGVIGLGSIGMRHATNLVGLGHKVYGIDPAVSDHPDITLVNEFHHPCDAFVIASPTKDHIGHIETLLPQNKPIFIEKPIADQWPSVATGNIMMVGYNLRYHPCVIKAKEWIGANSVGDILWANFTVAQFNTKAAYLRDGVILNWSHEIDLALYLLGPASVLASATHIAGGHDDIADIILGHESGANSVVHLDYVTEPEVRQFIIVGKKAHIICDLVNRQSWLRGVDGGMLDHFQAYDSFDEDYVEEIQDFINLLDGKEFGFHCTAEHALSVLKICLDVRKQAGL